MSTLGEVSELSTVSRLDHRQPGALANHFRSALLSLLLAIVLFEVKLMLCDAVIVAVVGIIRYKVFPPDRIELRNMRSMAQDVTEMFQVVCDEVPGYCDSVVKDPTHPVIVGIYYLRKSQRLWTQHVLIIGLLYPIQMISRKFTQATEEKGQETDQTKLGSSDPTLGSGMFSRDTQTLFDDQPQVLSEVGSQQPITPSTQPNIIEPTPSPAESLDDNELMSAIESQLAERLLSTTSPDPPAQRFPTLSNSLYEPQVESIDESQESDDDDNDLLSDTPSITSTISLQKLTLDFEHGVSAIGVIDQGATCCLVSEETSKVLGAAAVGTVGTRKLVRLRFSISQDNRSVYTWNFMVVPHPGVLVVGADFFNAHPKLIALLNRRVA